MWNERLMREIKHVIVPLLHYNAQAWYFVKSKRDKLRIRDKWGASWQRDKLNEKSECKFLGGSRWIYCNFSERQCSGARRLATGSRRLGEWEMKSKSENRNVRYRRPKGASGRERGVSDRQRASQREREREREREVLPVYQGSAELSY